jgi:hypothetical protein
VAFGVLFALFAGGCAAAAAAERRLGDFVDWEMEETE